MANAPVAYQDTIDAIAGNVLTVSTAPPSLPTYGHRFVWFTTGVAKHEVRKITAVTATTVTVDSLPAGVAVNDTIRISSTLADYAVSIPALVGTSDIDYVCNEDIVFVDGSYLAMWGQSLLFGVDDNYNCSGTADQMWQMGYRNPQGYIEGGCRCSMPDTNDDRLSVNTGGGSSGVQVKWFGSQIYMAENAAGDYFGYFLNFNDPNTMPQIEGCSFFLSGGFRIGGTNGILRDNLFYSVSDQAIYPFTTRGVLAIVDNNVVVNGRQSFYWSQDTNYGGSTTIRGHGAVSTTYDFRLVTGSSNQILTSIDDTMQDILSIDGSFDSGGSIDRFSGMRSICRDLSGTALENVSIRNTNTDHGQVVTATSAADGTMPEQLVWRQRRNSSGSANYYNNVARFRKFGYVFNDKAWDSRSPLTDIEFLATQDGVTQASGTAAAHTGISVAIGTYNLFTKTFSVKVVGNLTTNPSLTAEDIYNYLQYHLSLHATFNGQAGTYWHELVKYQGGVYNAVRGTYGATLRGVVVVDENDDPFPGIASMQADDGTTYVPPSTVTIAVTCIDETGSPIENARVYIEAGSGGPETQGTVLLSGLTNASGVVQNAGYSYSGDQPLQNGRARKSSSSPYYKQASIGGTITAAGFSATVTMVSDE